MTLQPLVTPVTDLELIAHLDHDPAVPCCCAPPFHVGDQAAAYAFAERCHPMPGLKPICAPCWDRLATFPLWECTTCGRWAVGRDGAFVIVTVIGGPRS